MTSDADPVAQLAINLTGGLAQLLVMLGDLDEDGYAYLQSRLDAIRHLVEQMPDAPGRPTRRVGFTVRPRRRQR